MYDVFISYSSSDRGWSEALEEKLVHSGLSVYRDKTRLAAAKPYQPQLFEAISDSGALILLWSERVRNMQGDWKEWVITERENFRAKHPDSPIIYLLLDDSKPGVDGQDHKLDQFIGEDTPSKVAEAKWISVISGIKKLVWTDKVEIDCYIVACDKKEFESLEHDPNLGQVLGSLGLQFSDVVKWYGDSREEWKPAGGRPLNGVISDLEKTLTQVLTEPGVPDHYRNKKLMTKTAASGLWAPDDDIVSKEVERMQQVEFGWFFIDPLSLYHQHCYRVAQRIAKCLSENSGLNVFLIDPVGNLRDRSSLRKKLQLDCSDLYRRLLRPNFDATPQYLGAIDAWHKDDFEKVFRETVRRHREGLALDKSKTSGSAFTAFTRS